MRLVDLNPRWFAEAGRHGQGLTFECPCCRGTPRATRIGVAFWPPLDGGERIPVAGPPNGFEVLCAALWPVEHVGTDIVPPGTHWQRTGDTFETLTLWPSVDSSRAGHWHGFIRNGAIS